MSTLVRGKKEQNKPKSNRRKDTLTANTILNNESMLNIGPIFRQLDCLHRNLRESTQNLLELLSKIIKSYKIKGKHKKNPSHIYQQ